MPLTPDNLPLRVVWNDEPTTGLNLLQKGLQSSLAKLGVPVVRPQRAHWMRQFARVAAKAGVIKPLFNPKHRSIVTIAWASESTLVPVGYYDRVVPFIFDCWPEQFDKWETLLKKYNITLAFVSAKDAGTELARRIPALQWHWLPEACDASLYNASMPLCERGIHVLEMGRKHPVLHAQLRRICECDRSINHVYSRLDSSTPIYPTLPDLYRAMGNTLISICFPKSATHGHDQRNRVETMTQRYLETIGNGALAVGSCPSELNELFGFDPVVPLDVSNPEAQIRDIINNPQAYQSLADKARARLLEVGTFDNRAQTMLRVLR